MNKEILQTKEKLVDKLVSEIKDSNSFLFFEYMGINAKVLTTLRRELHNANAKLTIAKNNIFNRAINICELGSQIPEITGPCAIITVKAEDAVGFKILKKIISDYSFIKFRIGHFENNVVSIDNFDSISSLPSRNELYSILLSCLQGTMRNLAYGLKSVAESKNN